MENLETLNERLREHFGIDSDTARPIFRIVWSDYQTEMRLTDTLDSGLKLLHPIVRECKKYPYLKEQWILERLVVVPDVNQVELPTAKLSYEPIWGYGRGTPPIWDATKFIIDTLYAALGKRSLAKYKDSEENTTPEGREHRIEKLEKELFGNETNTTDALAHNQGIVVPYNYKKES